MNSYELPTEGQLLVSENEIDALLEEWESDLRVPENFEQTAPPFQTNAPHGPVIMYENPQTIAFLKKLNSTETCGPRSIIEIEDFVGKPSEICPETEGSADDAQQLPVAMEPPSSGRDTRLFAEQTPRGKMIKRRNASMYNND